MVAFGSVEAALGGFTEAGHAGIETVLDILPVCAVDPEAAPLAVQALPAADVRDSLEAVRGRRRRVAVVPLHAAGAPVLGGGGGEEHGQSKESDEGAEDRHRGCELG